MTNAPEWLPHLQSTLHSVALICAYIGITFAWYDWQYWKNNEDLPKLSHYRIYSPALVLVLGVFLLHGQTLLYGAVGDYFTAYQMDLATDAAAHGLLICYFYFTMVFRVKAYGLPKNAMFQRIACISAAILLLSIVGYYA